MSPYRTAAEQTEEAPAPETPEAILYDTLQRLNRIDECDAQRVVRGLAAFIGFSVGPRESVGSVDDDAEDADGDEAR